jgi:hypothetical protein
VTSTGSVSPVTATVTSTVTAVGSNTAADADAPTAVGPAELEALGAGDRVATGGAAVSVGRPLGVGEQAAETRTTLMRAATRIRDIGGC